MKTSDGRITVPGRSPEIEIVEYVGYTAATTAITNGWSAAAGERRNVNWSPSVIPSLLPLSIAVTFPSVITALPFSVTISGFPGGYAPSNVIVPIQTLDSWSFWSQRL